MRKNPLAIRWELTGDAGRSEHFSDANRCFKSQGLLSPAFFVEKIDSVSKAGKSYSMDKPTWQERMIVGNLENITYHYRCF